MEGSGAPYPHWVRVVAVWNSRPLVGGGGGVFRIGSVGAAAHDDHQEALLDPGPYSCFCFTSALDLSLFP